MLPPEYRNAEGFARFGAEAGALAARLLSAGVRLSYHNHSFELERYGSETGLALLLEAGGPSLGASSTPTGSSTAAGARPDRSGHFAAGCRRST